MPATTPSAINAADDRTAIIDLTLHYAWALDSRQFDLLDDVFVEDATAELRSSPLIGREAIRQRIRNSILALDATQHTVTNHIVSVTGDTATSRAYLHSQHVRLGTPGGDLYVIAGRYEDELVRTSLGWRISFRRLVVVWTDGNIAVVRRPPDPASS